MSEELNEGVRQQFLRAIATEKELFRFDSQDEEEVDVIC